MKSDSERQIEYQERRLKRQRRVTFWLPHEEYDLMKALNGDPLSVTGFVRQAVRDAICRGLLEEEPLSEKDVLDARIIGEEKFRMSLPME